MSRQHEVSLNNNLAQLLDGMFSQSQVQPENTDAPVKKTSKRPNIRITGNDASVIIEAEFDPANNVENEAQKRLKSRLKNQSRPVESIIALIYPQELRQASNLKTALPKPACAIAFFTPTTTTSPNTAGWKVQSTI